MPQLPLSMTGFSSCREMDDISSHFAEWGTDAVAEWSSPSFASINYRLDARLTRQCKVARQT